MSKSMTRRIARYASATLAALVILVSGVATGPRAGADDGNWGPAIPGEFIARLKPDGDPAAASAAAGGVTAPERLSPTSPLYRFKLPASVTPQAGVDLLKNTGHIDDAQPNVLAELPEFYGGKRLFWADNDLPDTTAAASGSTISQPALGNAGLPATGASGQGVVVAVLDTGIDTAHPSFAGRIAPGGYDFIDRDANPAEVANGIDENGNGLVDEAYGHGTYVAGIVGTVAPAARVLPIRIIDTDGLTSSWLILQGVDLAAARGARVTNLSLGGVNLGELVEVFLEDIYNAGMVLVAAAGNENTADLRYPAANPGVVGVTSINGATGAKADFANYGSWIDVAAPGVRIVSAYPGGRYAIWGGTSASAPVAAAALARIAGVLGPQTPASDVIDRLTASSNATALPNLSAYGRIDVQAAVNRALGL